MKNSLYPKKREEFIVKKGISIKDKLEYLRKLKIDKFHFLNNNDIVDKDTPRTKEKKVLYKSLHLVTKKENVINLKKLRIDESLKTKKTNLSHYLNKTNNSPSKTLENSYHDESKIKPNEDQIKIILDTEINSTLQNDDDPFKKSSFLKNENKILRDLTETVDNSNILRKYNINKRFLRDNLSINTEVMTGQKGRSIEGLSVDKKNIKKKIMKIDKIFTGENLDNRFVKKIRNEFKLENFYEKMIQNRKTNLNNYIDCLAMDSLTRDYLKSQKSHTIIEMPQNKSRSNNPISKNFYYIKLTEKFNSKNYKKYEIN